MASPVPVTLDPSPPTGSGLLSAARPLPTGWQRGIAFTDNSCLPPVVMGECPSGTNMKPGNRGEATMFRPVSVVMAVECTTMGAFSATENTAAGELDRVRDFALAREMLTGEASARDRNTSALDLDGNSWGGNPSLQSEASDLGATFGTVAEAVACIEQNLAEATSGRGGLLFIGDALATYLFAARTIWRDGARWRTAGGNSVIVSGGFDGRAPTDTAAPIDNDPLYIYAVSNIWGAVGDRIEFSDINRAVNTETSRAEDLGLVAFSPCAVFAAASTAATAC
jgi:hypothetical protein